MAANEEEVSPGALPAPALMDWPAWDYLRMWALLVGGLATVWLADAFAAVLISWWCNPAGVCAWPLTDRVSVALDIRITGGLLFLAGLAQRIVLAVADRTRPPPPKRPA